MTLAVFSSTALTSAGVVANGADVEVRREDTGALASIYSDEAGTTPITNPAVAFTDSNGRFSFYAAGIDRGYSVKVTKSADTFTLHNVAIGTAGQLDQAAIVLASTAAAMSDPLGRAGEIQNLSLAFTVAASALTCNIKTRAAATPTSTAPVAVSMRSATIGSGVFNARTITAALSLVISSGSTLGHTSAVASRIYWYLIDNAGTLELAASTKFFGQQGIITTVAEGGAGAADSASVMYSTTARAGVAFRCVGRTIDTQATAGTWAAVPSTIELAPFDDPVLPKVIYGLTYDIGTDTVNDLNINVGGATDATGAYMMTLSTALGKQSDVAWAVGGTTAAPAGALDTGAVGNSDYYIWLIARSDTGVVDVLYSLSPTAPTMPSNYDFKRLIGWFKRSGGTIVAFKTYELTGGGLEFLWSATREDINLAATLTTSRRTDALSVPLGFSVQAHLLVFINDANAGQVAYIYNPDANDEAATGSRANIIVVSGSGGGRGSMRIRTSATGTIASRADVATMDNYQVTTTSFEWARRN